MRKPDVVTIPRPRWTEGEFGSTPDGHCALGWLWFEVTGRHYVDQFDEDAPTFTNLFPIRFRMGVVRINDFVADRRRGETLLRELFAKEGMQLRFVGDYVSTTKTAEVAPIEEYALVLAQNGGRPNR